MSADSKIYADAGPATLNDGADKLTDCVTLHYSPAARRGARRCTSASRSYKR
jgi:hypothetical protein